MKDLISAEALKEESELLQAVSEKINSLKKGCKEIASKSKQAEEIENLPTKAKFFADKITKLLEEVRIPADELEKLVPDILWPLPKYSEMLFVL